MPKIDIVNGRLTIDTVFRDRDLVKQIPGARFIRASESWEAPLSWGVLWAIKGVFKDRAEPTQAVVDWATSEWNDRISFAMDARGQMDLPATESDPQWWQDLWGFQRVGARFMATVGQALLGDEMGTGKTIQAIGAMRLIGDVFPALIVCPNSMKRVWRRELAAWWPDATVNLVEGGAATRRTQLEMPADIYIVNWESLRLHSRLAPYGSVHVKGCEICTPGNIEPQSKCQRCPRELNTIGFKTIIADEAHRMKDPKSQQTRALWSLGAGSTYRFSLTGTPIANHPGDLWSLIHFISPDDWPSKTRYIDRYCAQSWNGFGGMSIVGLRHDHADEFRRIFEPRFIRRPKSAVLPYLPPKVYQKRYVTMGGKQAKAYKSMAKEMIAMLDNDESVVVTNALAKAVRLSQFAAAYAEIDENDKLILTDPSCKVDELMELIDEAGDGQMVVFAESRQLIRMCETRLEKVGIKYGVIAGGVSPEDRDTFIQGFAERDLQVMLVTFGAGGEGITLLAPTAVFLQRPWSLVQSKQAEDRVHRPGAEVHDKIFIIDVVTEDTIEERRFAVLEDKDARFEEVVRDKDTFRRLIG